MAIETPRGLLVAALRASGRPVYPINPMAVARYRERYSMSGKKSDHADAMVLANICVLMPTGTASCPPIVTLLDVSRCWRGHTRTPPGVAPVPATS